MSILIGTSGWSYKEWKGNFYPERLAARRYLAHYAGHFPCVEVDSSFYAEPAPATLDAWLEKTPETFRFALKVPRAITHERMLEGCVDEFLGFLERTGRLGTRRGPVILQLPPSFTRRHLPHLFTLVESLPERPGVSVEFRHESCYAPETFDALRTHGVGLVTTHEHTGLLLSGPDVVLRLLGTRGEVTAFDRVSIDRAEELAAWAERLEQLPDWVENAWVFLNNNYTGHAPTTAAELGVRLGVLEPPASPGRQASLFG